MDEEGMERPTSLVTDADLAIAKDIEKLIDLEQRISCVKNRVTILDAITQERKSWWRA